MGFFYFFFLGLSMLGSLVLGLMLGAPRFLQILQLGSALLALWLFSQWQAVAGLAWLAVVVGQRLLLEHNWKRRDRQADGTQDRAAIFLSVSRAVEDGKAPFVLWLTPFKGPSYWLARRLKNPVPQAGNRPASELLLPLLDRVYGSRSGFTLDTRHLQAAMPPGQQAGPALVIRCV